ncbi:hypothetical protein ABFS83_09G037700 [Erythranthe nasuta]
MFSISEKSILSSRLLSFLIAFSMFLLISSSLSLIEFEENSFVPKSVLQLIPNLVSNASINYQIPSAKVVDAQESPVKSPVFPNETLNNKQDTISVDEPEEHITKKCDKTEARLKVYMYDLPPKFHFGLLGWNAPANQAWPSLTDRVKLPSYPGGLNLQHSTEYWLTLDLLSSSNKDIVRPCTAIRVENSSEADVIFVPFFSSLSYNRFSKHRQNRKGSGDKVLQEELVDFLVKTKEWKRSRGKDHLIVAHHPNSMLIARRKLGSCMFVLSDFGRYSSRIANLKKDVIAPYKHMVRSIAADNSPSFDERPILAYFQGAIYRKDGGAIRHELYYLLKNEKDVHFTFGSAHQSTGVREAGKGMAHSKFCLNIAGDTPSSNRLFDAIATHCVPVIISDEIELPFEDVLDYSEFCVFVRAKDAIRKGHLLNILRGIKNERWSRMWEKLKEISGHFEYEFPSRENDAVDMIWQTVSRKKVPNRLSVHRKNRYTRSQFRLRL